MRLLILGGTGFAGLHTARQALEHGHELWVFNRGKTRPDALPGATRLQGDRKGDIESLRDTLEFDAVIDFTGYLPSEVTATAEALKDRAQRYIFVSSISAYAWPFPLNATEDTPLAVLPDGVDATQVTGETYGALKALCEAAVTSTLGERATIIRPGLIVGPEDPTDRFTYWIRRGIEGGRVLAPGDPARPFQVIDVRDIADFMLELARNDTPGTFNATGDQMPMGSALGIACAGVDLVWIGDDELVAAGVEPGIDLPIWIPGEEGNAFGAVSNARAKDSGLSLRPLEDTVDALRTWDIERGQPALKTGMSRERQDELVASSRPRLGTIGVPGL